MVNVMWHLVPISGFRDWLLRAHIAGCAFCQEQAASRDEVVNFLRTEACSWPEKLLVRTEAIAEERKEKKEEKKARPEVYSPWPRRLYAGAVALIIVLLMVGFARYLVKSSGKEDKVHLNGTCKTDLVSKVSLIYIRAMGQPASTYIFQTADPEMIIIWAEAGDQF